MATRDMQNSIRRRLWQPDNMYSLKARERSPTQKDKIFLIAPTICMKTKVEFWRVSIAPTILMKMNELMVFSGKCHDVVENTCGYTIKQRLIKST